MKGSKTTSIRVVFKGHLADLIGEDGSFTAAKEQLDWEGLLTLCAELPGGSVLVEDLRDGRVKLSVRGKVLDDKHSLKAADGDEIVVLSPTS